MGVKIIVQDDGNFAAYTTISDTMLLVDATREELVEWWVKRQAANARREIEQDLEWHDQGLNRFSQTTLLEALGDHRAAHCEDKDWNAFIAKRLKEEEEKDTR